MHKNCALFSLILVLPSFFLPNAVFSQEPLRTWTDTQGKKAVARLVKIENNQVTLQNRQGKTLVLRLSRLSEDDNLYVQELQLRDNAAPQQIPPAEKLLEMAAEQANRITAPAPRASFLLWTATLQAKHGFNDMPAVAQAYAVYRAQKANTQLEMLPDFLAYHASTGDFGASRKLLNDLPKMACQRVSTYTTEHEETVWVDKECTRQVAETVTIPCNDSSCGGNCSHSRTETVYRDETYIGRVQETITRTETHYDYYTSPPTEAETLKIYLKYADSLASYAYDQETQRILGLAQPLIASLPRNMQDQSLAWVSQVQMDLGEMASAFQATEQITLSSMRVRSLCEMAKIYLIAGNKPEYERYLADAYDLVTREIKAARTSRDMAVAVAGLNEVLKAMLFDEDGGVPEAYLKEARKFVPKLEILSDRTHFCITLADIYLRMGNHAQARALQRLLPQFKIPLLAHIIDVQTADGAEKEAEQTLKSMRSHVAKLKNPYDRLLCNLHCAVRYKKIGNDKQAAVIFTQTEKSAAKIKETPARQRTYHSICEAYASVFDFPNAERMLLRLDNANLRNDIIQKIAKQKIRKNMPEEAYRLARIAGDAQTAAGIFIAIAENALKQP